LRRPERTTPLDVVRRVVAGALAFFIFRTLVVLASVFAFPIGGGEFHAIFAYSGGGRIGPALHACAVYVGALAMGVLILILLRYPLSWRGVGWIAAVTGTLSWLRVCAWPTQSPLFRIVAMLALFAIPPMLLGVAFVGQALRRATTAN
jgi:hypothetical protein